MAARWRDPSAFRADPAAAPAPRPSRRETLALLTVLALVAAAVAVASYLVRPDRARAFDLFHGSLFLSAEQSPVAVDLATGKPTLRLVGADKQVSVTGTDTLGVVPLQSRTLLLNNRTGEFNMVDSSGFVVKHDGGGVPLPKTSGRTSAMAVASGDLAYIVRTGVTRSDVYLVSQATVQSALYATKAVKPRASTVLQGVQADVGPGGSATADGSLWLLVGSPAGAGQRTIRQLSVPADSSAGAVLDSADRGTVTGVAALGTATTGRGATARTVVAVATADHLTLFDGAGAGRRLDFPAEDGVDQILPAGDAEGRLAFFLHGSAGWSVVSVASDGSTLRFPHPLRGVPAGARLVPPAYSRGGLYTMDSDSGRLYRVDMDGNSTAPEGASRYPVAVLNGAEVDTHSAPDAYAVARGSRIVFNSPTRPLALILFTDGSHAPETIEKSLAVDVSAAGGAEELTKSTVSVEPPGKPTTGGNKTKPTNTQPINNKIDCRTATQTPHIPNITQVQAGSRSVTLGWTYPILDNQDCYPSTYVVSVKLLSNGAPQPPSSVRVQSQAGATITGLFPESRYELKVTAYINGQGTSSPPIQIHTGPEGPAAPTDVTVRTDSTGGWILDWNSCGSVEQGCVAAQSWTVTPSFCDGRGLGAPPTPITAPADPTSRRQPSVRYPGSDALLGRGLQFVVTGSGTTQVLGTPSAQSPCVYSWAPPDPSTMRLSASQPANTSLGGSTTTNVTLDLGANPVRDVGGLGATATFTLTGNGTTQTRGPITYDGRSTTLSANFGGVEAGATYTASATVQPAHGGSAVAIPPVTVSTRADWPDVTLTPSCPRDSGALSCPLSVQVNGITSAQARGEHFDFDGQLVCGSAGMPVTQADFDPANPIQVGNVSQLDQFFGSCTVSGTLRENAGSPQPEVFGGTSKAVPAAPVSLGAPVTSGAGQSDFAVTWGGVQGNGDVNANIQYLGTDDLGGLTRSWSETVTGPDGTTDCGNPDGTAVPDTRVAVSARCIADFAASGGSWSVDISYTNRTDGSRQGPFHYSLPNPIPDYQYCTPAGYQASWGQTVSDGVTVESSGGDLSGCGGWSYELRSPQSSCGTATGAPPATIALSCADDPTQGTWTVVVSWTDSAGRSQTSDPIEVTGSPPSP